MGNAWVFGWGFPLFALTVFAVFYICFDSWFCGVCALVGGCLDFDLYWWLLCCYFFRLSLCCDAGLTLNCVNFDNCVIVWFMVLIVFLLLLVLYFRYV